MFAQVWVVGARRRGGYRRVLGGYSWRGGCLPMFLIVTCTAIVRWRHPEAALAHHQEILEGYNG